MKKFQVNWKEISAFYYCAIVKAESKEEAIEKLLSGDVKGGKPVQDDLIDMAIQCAVEIKDE